MANSISRNLLLQEIAHRGWQAEEIGPKAYFLKITHPDGRWEMLHGTLPKRSSAIGYQIAKNKHLTMDFAASLGYRTPPYQVIQDVQSATAFLAANGKIVMKPADGERTLGVTVGITDPHVLPTAFEFAKSNSESGQVIVQKHLEGRLYRLLVLDGRFIAGSLRVAPTVTGDAIQTIEQLITRANQDPRRGKGTDTALKQIDLTYARALLGDEAIVAVPALGEQVAVSDIDSVSAGGEAVNVSPEVHEDWQKFCIHMAHEAGLFIAGYDVICDDISQPIPADYIPLLEVNAGPGMKLHEFPTGGGEAIHLAPLLLDALFPALTK